MHVRNELGTLPTSALGVSFCVGRAKPPFRRRGGRAVGADGAGAGSGTGALPSVSMALVDGRGRCNSFMSASSVLSQGSYYCNLDRNDQHVGHTESPFFIVQIFRTRIDPRFLYDVHGLGHVCRVGFG